MTTTIDDLNEIASKYPGGMLYVKDVIESKGRWAVQWEIVFGDDSSTDSVMRFVNPDGFQPTRQAAIDKELSELQERIVMDIFGTELFPYLQGEMFGGKDVTMTIKAVKIEELANSQGKENKPVIYFKERPKGLILNKTNAKAVAKLYGRETDDWVGKKVTMYAEAGTWFGKPGFAIRVRDKVVNGGKKSKAAPFGIDDIDFEGINEVELEMIKEMTAEEYNEYRVEMGQKPLTPKELAKYDFAKPHQTQLIMETDEEE